MGTSVEQNREQYKNFLKEQEKKRKINEIKKEQNMLKENTENKIIKKLIYLNEKEKKEILNYIENILKKTINR